MRARQSFSIVKLEEAERAAESLLALSRESYLGGASSLTDVLTAERSLASSRLSSASALRNYTLNWVGLHIASGQGWRVIPLLAPEETVLASVPANPLGN